VRPFIKADLDFTDSKFFEEDFTPKEMMILIISSMGKGDSKAVKDTPMAMKDNKQIDEVQSAKQVGKQVAVLTHSGALILKYFPKSHQKEGDHPLLRSQIEMLMIRLP